MQAEADTSVEHLEMQGRTLLYDKGTSRTFGLLIRCHDSLHPNANLQVGTTGNITWVGRLDMPKWTFLIGNPPREAASTDVYAVVWPPVVETEGIRAIDSSLPMHVIDVRKEVEAMTFRDKVQNGRYDLVCMKISTSETPPESIMEMN